MVTTLTLCHVLCGRHNSFPSPRPAGASFLIPLSPWPELIFLVQRRALRLFKFFDCISVSMMERTLVCTSFKASVSMTCGRSPVHLPSLTCCVVVTRPTFKAALVEAPAGLPEPADATFSLGNVFPYVFWLETLNTSRLGAKATPGLLPHTSTGTSRLSFCRHNVQPVTSNMCMSPPPIVTSSLGTPVCPLAVAPGAEERVSFSPTPHNILGERSRHAANVC